jgi:hypothetical protein
MIAPDSAAGLRAEQRFDLIAAILIGAIAVLAAFLAILQIGAGQAATRAELEAARLASDLSARISVSGQATDSGLTSKQVALFLGMESAARELAGAENNDASTTAVGAAQAAAYQKLNAALDATTKTSGGAPVDAYTAGMLGATTQQLLAELAEQNRQVDLANQAGNQQQKAVFGLSLLALAGVLTGLAAVLREGRGGWIALCAACVVALASGWQGVAVLLRI